MSEAEANASRHLGDYVSLLRRQWLVILVVTVVGVAAGFGALAMLPKSYSASSAVLVRATTDPAGAAEATDARVPGEVNMDTESQVVKSLLVAGAVKESLDSPLTPPQLAAAVSVSIPPNTTIMTIQYEASSASEAQQGAEAFAKAYLDNRARVAQSHVDTQVKQLDQQAADINEQIQTLLRKLPTLEGGSTERLTAEQSLRRLRSKANWTDRQVLPLGTAQTDPGSIIVAAQAPRSADSPSTVLVLGSGVILGVLAALMLAWLRDNRSGRIRVAPELESEHSMEVLGVVTETRLVEGGDSKAVSRYRRSLQDYRHIVHAIQARIAQGQGALLLSGVGSDSVAEELSHTLGTAAARSGTDVVLVYSNDDVTAACAPPSNVSRPDVVATGATLEATSLEAAGLLVDGDVQNRVLPRYLEMLTSSDQLVMLSTPPTGRSADAQAVSPFVGLTVLVVELNRTTHSDIAAALRQLHQVGVEQVSAIVVGDGTRRRGRRRPVPHADPDYRDTPVTDDASDHDEPTEEPDAAVAEIGTREPAGENAGRPDAERAFEDAR